MMSAQGEIAELMRDCDVGAEMDPVKGLMEVVRISGTMMRLLVIKVGELSEDPEIQEILVEGRDGDLSTKLKAGRDGFWGLSKDGEMVGHVYLTLLKQWAERYEKACATALSAGVAERQVKLAENQAELLATAVKAILTGLNLTPEQWELAPKVVAAQLRAVSA